MVSNLRRSNWKCTVKRFFKSTVMLRSYHGRGPIPLGVHRFLLCLRQGLNAVPTWNENNGWKVRSGRNTKKYRSSNNIVLHQHLVVWPPHTHTQHCTYSTTLHNCIKTEEVGNYFKQEEALEAAREQPGKGAVPGLRAFRLPVSRFYPTAVPDGATTKFFGVSESWEVARCNGSKFSETKINVEKDTGTNIFRRMSCFLEVL